MNYRFYGQFAARGRAGARRAVPRGLRRVLRRGLLRDGDDAVPLGRRAGVPASERLEPRRVLQRAISSATRACHFPQGRLVVGRHGRPRRTKLTRDDDGDGTVDTYGLGVDPEIIRVAPSSGPTAGRLVDDETSPTQFALDGPARSRRLSDSSTSGRRGVTPTDEEAEAEDFESRFLNGRLAMLMESRRVVPTLRTITDFDWDVAGFPGCTNRRRCSTPMPTA